ncbi:MAG: hypothetical protein E3J91_03625 [Hadesarchaea archaeon]|nr:MAG: hypothetical protein E3J91_03625 [Hadesarchaea archaeon]
MGERALSWGLRLLGIALFVGPFIAAFAVHNWDLKATVMPSQEEMDEITETISGLFGEGFSEDTFTIGTPTSSGNTIRIPVRLTSPLNLPIKITDLSLTMSDQGVEVAQVEMEETEVEIPANGTVDFTLIGPYTGTLPTDPQPTDVNITFEAYGVTLQMQVGQGGEV